MKSSQQFLNAMTAAAFAEAAEFDTAREMAAMHGQSPAGAISPAQQHWAAVAFAEAGEFDTAREMVGQSPADESGQDATALTGVCSHC
ncbi:MAG: hypothetical protein OEV91_04300 [Desulfobulbaceae bacterium]|nr:hypothetical protein [Desulfobulbaceae bacterium]